MDFVNRISDFFSIINTELIPNENAPGIYKAVNLHVSALRMICPRSDSRCNIYLILTAPSGALRLTEYNCHSLTGSVISLLFTWSMTYQVFPMNTKLMNALVPEVQPSARGHLK
jgi:hypothetical protein